MRTRSIEQRQADLENQLFTKYGPLVGGKHLRHLLGYKTGMAFRQAIKDKKAPVPTFQQKPEARWGIWHANTKDVAAWIARMEERAEAIWEELLAARAVRESQPESRLPDVDQCANYYANDQQPFWIRLKHLRF